jgi:8-oxo-dGTP pyrophosphatase MutT (NUDIX family)
MNRSPVSIPFWTAVERLMRLPDPLPTVPQVLIPVAVGGTTERPPRPVEPARLRSAAVLVLLVPGPDGEARVILTERVVGGRHHSGEVSFPGGAAEPEDADSVATALREAAEEVALDAVAAGVRIVGTLDPFWIPVSGYHVTPVLAIAERRPALTPHEAEVVRVLEAPLAAFLPGAPIEIVERTIRGWSLRYGAYVVDGLHVWGATARILGQLGGLFSED